jgi:molybdate transport system ATP-binding protein
VSLEAHLRVVQGQFALGELECSIASGETVVLLGPNGAGKSTVLRALAGITPIDAGRIVLDDEVLDDTIAGVYVPPDARSIGVVFQDRLLFPHLDVLENVAFGLRARRVPRRVARARALEWLERVGGAELASARPGRLSGGEAQRVALARALAVEPRLLLLDEPLTALDATTRPRVRRDLARHLDAFDGAALVVTHDPLEAIALADRLVILEDGRITQSGSPAEVRERPRSRYVADVVGVNLYRGTAGPRGLEIADGALLVCADHDATGPAFAVVHPRAVALHRERPEGTPRNVWQGVVRHVDPEGERARVHVDGAIPITAEVTAVAVHELALAEGVPVWVTVKATEVAVYPA